MGRGRAAFPDGREGTREGGTEGAGGGSAAAAVGARSEVEAGTSLPGSWARRGDKVLGGCGTPHPRAGKAEGGGRRSPGPSPGADVRSACLQRRSPAARFCGRLRGTGSGRRLAPRLLSDHLPGAEHGGGGAAAPITWPPNKESRVLTAPRCAVLLGGAARRGAAAASPCPAPALPLPSFLSAGHAAPLALSGAPAAGQAATVCVCLCLASSRIFTWQPRPSQVVIATRGCENVG